MSNSKERERQVNTWFGSLYGELEGLEAINKELLSKLSPVMTAYNVDDDSKEPVAETELVPVANELRSISERIHKVFIIHRNILELLEI